MTNNKFLILIINFACILCIDVYWTPYSPSIGEEITIFADVSKNKEFQFRYPMYIHLSNDGESYKSYLMKLDYLQKSSTWAYSFIIDSTTFFQIDNNRLHFKNEDWKNAKSPPFFEVPAFLFLPKVQGCNSASSRFDLSFWDHVSTSPLPERMAGSETILL